MKSFFTFLLIAISIQLQAQLSREQAINIVIAEIIYPDSLQFTRLYSKYEMMFEGDTLWQEGQFGYHLVPYDECWIFFIDDAPVVNWAHPCRYVFLRAENGETEVVEDNWPPESYFSVSFFDDWEWILETGIEKINLSNVSIYPNPFDELINITFEAHDQGKILILLSDESGRCVLKSTTFDPIKTSHLSEGLYFIKVFSEGKMKAQKKLVKKAH